MTRTPSGGARVPLFVARSGVQVYRGPDGREVREYRPDSEVFAPESLATLTGAPVTIGHRGLVSPKNWRSVAHGAVTGAPERVEESGVPFVSAHADLTSEESIAKADSGELAEVSAGYTCDVDETPGIAPDGERYDRIQRSIRFNHIALGPVGFARAGRSARLRLDGNESEDRTMIKIGTESFDVSTDEGRAACQTRIDGLASALTAANAATGEAAAKLAAAEAKADAERARADAATVRADAAEKSVAERADSVIAFRSDMRSVLGDSYDFAGKSDRQVRLDAIAAVEPTAKPREDASDDYVAAYLDALRAKPRENYAPAKRAREDSGAAHDHIKFLDSQFHGNG